MSDTSVLIKDQIKTFPFVKKNLIQEVGKKECIEDIEKIKDLIETKVLENFSYDDTVLFVQKFFNTNSFEIQMFMVKMLNYDKQKIFLHLYNTFNFTVKITKKLVMKSISSPMNYRLILEDALENEVVKADLNLLSKCIRNGKTDCIGIVCNNYDVIPNEDCLYDACEAKCNNLIMIRYFHEIHGLSLKLLKCENIFEIPNDNECINVIEYMTKKPSNKYIYDTYDELSDVFVKGRIRVIEHLIKKYGIDEIKMCVDDIVLDVKEYTDDFISFMKERFGYEFKSVDNHSV